MTEEAGSHAPKVCGGIEAHFGSGETETKPRSGWSKS